MREFLLHVIRNIVDHPDSIILDQEESGDKIIFKLQVHKDDLGKIIGRKGRNAMALRTLLKAVAAKEKKRAILELDE